MRRVCPKCGRVVSGACPRCGASHSGWKRTPEQERARRESNPWRLHYGSKAYKDACQIALSRTRGRCAVSGARIADYRNGRWALRPYGGIHHRVPLSQGGSDDPSNLVPLHVRVHNKIDAELRRRRK